MFGGASLLVWPVLFRATSPNTYTHEVQVRLKGSCTVACKKNGKLHRIRLAHNPMRILRVDRPIFHFSVITKSMYDGVNTYR